MSTGTASGLLVFGIIFTLIGFYFHPIVGLVFSAFIIGPLNMLVSSILTRKLKTTLGKETYKALEKNIEEVIGAGPLFIILLGVFNYAMGTEATFSIYGIILPTLFRNLTDLFAFIIVLEIIVFVGLILFNRSLKSKYFSTKVSTQVGKTFPAEKMEEDGRRWKMEEHTFPAEKMEEDGLDYEKQNQGIKLQINGYEIMKLLGLQQGPKIGKIISEIKELIEKGELKNNKTSIKDYLLKDTKTFEQNISL